MSNRPLFFIAAAVLLSACHRSVPPSNASCQNRIVEVTNPNNRDVNVYGYGPGGTAKSATIGTEFIGVAQPGVVRLPMPPGVGGAYAIDNDTNKRMTNVKFRFFCGG